MKEFKEIVSQGTSFYLINREVNYKALSELGLTKENCKHELLTLSVMNYCSGPKQDKDIPGKYGNSAK